MDIRHFDGRVNFPSSQGKRSLIITLKELNFAGTKFHEFYGFWCLPRNLIHAKDKYVVTPEI